jgi:hypothetical protein
MKRNCHHENQYGTADHRSTPVPPAPTRQDRTLALAGEAPRKIGLERLAQLEQMIATFDSLAARLLSSEGRAKALIGFFEGKL